MRRTKQSIEQSLLKGKGGPVKWIDPVTGRSDQIVLEKAQQRRLLAYLLKSRVRSSNDLDKEFIEGLKKAFAGQDDPADEPEEDSARGDTRHTWLLKTIETVGFGGINLYGGEPFEYDLNGDSLCLEGPNASGKSSLIGAVQWALTKERVRDQEGPTADVVQRREVFDLEGNRIGIWPPVAAYPNDPNELNKIPEVRVRLTFEDRKTGQLAFAERWLTEDDSAEDIDPRLKAAGSLIDIGLLMPSRLAHLRFGDKGGRLSEAVQALTGLESLVVLGDFVAELRHKGRKFLLYWKHEGRPEVEKRFAESIDAAERELPKDEFDLSPYQNLARANLSKELSALKNELSQTAAEKLAVLKDDLAEGLDLTNPKTQARINGSVNSAWEQLKKGWAEIPSIALLKKMTDASKAGQLARLPEKISETKKGLSQAIEWHRKQKEDRKLRLKTVAARYHFDQHPEVDEIDECPLCDEPLESEERKALAAELTVLRRVGEQAEKTLNDACNDLHHLLEEAVPKPLKNDLDMVESLEPKHDIIEDLRNSFVKDSRYAKTLIGAARVSEACLAALEQELPEFEEGIDDATEFRHDEEVPEPVEAVLALVKRVRKLCQMAEWWELNSSYYRNLWKRLIGAKDATTGQYPADCLKGHLTRLDEALVKAQPYSKASVHFASATVAANSWTEITNEQRTRESIAAALEPLTKLRQLVEAESKNSIQRLNSQIKAILNQIYESPTLRFRETILSKKVFGTRGSFNDKMKIDATLVANTSWLRAILWAFIFALREETIREIGQNPFPLMLLDDPQATFDEQHRWNWAGYLAGISRRPTDNPQKAQLLVVTCDRSFQEVELRIENVGNRYGCVLPATEEARKLAILDGIAIERCWVEFEASPTPNSAKSFAEAVRDYTEILMQFMLRAETAEISGKMNLGKFHSLLDDLIKRKISPFNLREFSELNNSLQSHQKFVQLINIAKHPEGRRISTGQAREIHDMWRGMRRKFDRAFSVFRGEKVRSRQAETVAPKKPQLISIEGHGIAVSRTALVLQGEVAAMSDGRVADGRMDLVDWDLAQQQKFVLEDHSVYRLTAPTLEPVASAGDLLIVANSAQVNPRNFVVVRVNDIALARRYQLSGDQADTAVLTAQAVYPYDIREPLVVPASSVVLQKVVGVLFDPKRTPYTTSEDEVAELAGESEVISLMRDIRGLFRIKGRSAEPYALDGQYLMVHNAISDESALDGHLVLAVDENREYYFKRFRCVDSETIILESLDYRGREGAILLGTKKGSRYSKIEEIMPVAGVLFELPA